MKLVGVKFFINYFSYQTEEFILLIILMDQLYLVILENGNTDQEQGNHIPPVESLFQKIENATMVPNRDSSVRGDSGELSVSVPRFRTAIADRFIDALNTQGVPYQDFNGQSPIGVDYAQSTVRDGWRHSAVDSYLVPIRHRKNLHLVLNALVSQVLIDPVTKTASGVQFTHSGRSFVVHTKKEVILSAGPVMSPQLLMLSGVGPREELERFKIPVVKELPVGQKYLDHIASGMYMFQVNTTGQNIRLREIGEDDAQEFVNYGTGKPTVPALIEAVAFINNGLRNVSREIPEV